MRLWAWGLSDVGRKRDHNEDSFLIQPELCLYAVADGMGGHAGGARASRLAVEILKREIQGIDPESQLPPGPGEETPPARYLRAAARLASRTIYELGEQEPAHLGMGTTLTALLFHGGRAHLAHVGDSRAYLFRDDHIEQLTKDHSWIEEQIRAGLISPADAKSSVLRHVITRSVGFERNVQVDLSVIPFLMGDCFLLCTDGLSNYLSSTELGHLLSQHYYSQVPARLVEKANERGGEDNITAVLIYAANDGSVDRQPDMPP